MKRFLANIKYNIQLRKNSNGEEIETDYVMLMNTNRIILFIAKKTRQIEKENNLLT